MKYENAHGFFIMAFATHIEFETFILTANMAVKLSMQRGSKTAMAISCFQDFIVYLIDRSSMDFLLASA